MSPEERRDRLSEIIQLNYPSLIRFIRRKWSDGDSADDVLNHVVERIYRLPNLSVPLESLASYLYRSISNRIIDLLRKKEPLAESLDRKNEEGNTLLELLEDHRYRPDRELEIAQLEQSLSEALGGLSEAERAVVVESEIHRVPFRLLSEEWGIPMGTLMTRKQRALKKMKEFLEAREANHD